MHEAPQTTDDTRFVLIVEEPEDTDVTGTTTAETSEQENMDRVQLNTPHENQFTVYLPPGLCPVPGVTLTPELRAATTDPLLAVAAQVWEELGLEVLDGKNSRNTPSRSPRTF